MPRQVRGACGGLHVGLKVKSKADPNPQALVLGSFVVSPLVVFADWQFHCWRRMTWLPSLAELQTEAQNLHPSIQGSCDRI